MSWDEARRHVLAAGAEYGTGASSDEIAAAEAELGQLPNDYRAFLRELGWLAVGSVEISGLGADVPFHLNLRRLTASERDEAGNALPPFLLPLRNDGAGNLDCIDTRPAARIVTWYHDEGPDQALPVASSFSVWLLDLMDRQKD